MPRTAQPKKTKWKTLRCVVEYRSQDQAMSERDLTRVVQYGLDMYLRDSDRTSFLIDSKPWAKAFSAVIGRMEGARPKKLAAAIRQLDATLKRLRAL